METTDTKQQIETLARAIRNTTACLQYANTHDDHAGVLKLTTSIITKAQEIETFAAALFGEQSKRKEPLLCSPEPEKSSQPSSLFSS